MVRGAAMLVVTLPKPGCPMPDSPAAPRPPVRLERAGAMAEELRARVLGQVPSVTRQSLMYISRRAVYPNTRARTLLGWEPQVPLAEGMARSEEWARAEGLLG